jgi:hypothetical protein
MAASVAARKAEVALRHGPRRRDGRVHLAPIRIAELCRLFRYRWGDILPDDDAGREDARIIAHHLAQLPGDQQRRIASWMGTWAPWMRLDEADRLIEAVLAKPFRWCADKLGKRLNLTEAVRTKLRITTIGSVDMTKAEREAARKARKRADMRQRRKNAGTKSRREYLAASTEQAKPWLAQGISRATWYRRQQQIQ